MAIELTGVVVRHERRLRLVFSNALAVGAFGSPAPAYYVLTNQDGKGIDPAIVAAIVVAGSSANVELALGADLVPGALYRLTAIGVPALDASTSTAASDELFRVGVPTTSPNEEAKVGDADLLLYGRDLVHTGDDYVETAEGDLAQIGGVANVKAAIRRRLLGRPLPWAPNYSPRARRYVDAPTPSIGGLRGDLEAQAMRDDRVRACKAKLIVDDTTNDEAYFEVQTTLLGGRAPDGEAINVPVTT